VFFRAVAKGCVFFRASAKVVCSSELLQRVVCSSELVQKVAHLDHLSRIYPKHSGNVLLCISVGDIIFLLN
jgi:hypothetical protein